MKAAVLFVALAAIAVASAIPILNIEEKEPATHAEWMSRFNRVYASAEEQALREQVWLSNDKIVKEHNGLLGSSYKLGHNQFSDMTNEEFRSQVLGLKVNLNATRGGSLFIPAQNVQLPASVDWRQQGAVTPIKNQGQCGSCWAFSTTGSLEGQHFLKTKNLVSLSEQNLVDCSQAEGNQGCNGGLMDDAFEYIKKNNGIDTEASYPYTAEDGTCKFKAANVGATVSGYTDISQGSESDLQNAVATVGPVSVAIDASHNSFQLYKSGVYNERACSSTQLDHGVLAIGYGTDSGKDFWLVKNSWGTSWGMKGYIEMSRNKNNQCGIATAASYPLVPSS